MDTSQLPPLLRKDGELENLGGAICREIDASEAGKGSLPERWKRVKDLYDLNPAATNLNLVPGMATYPIPLWKPKADRITGTVFKAITGIEPYVQLIPNSEDAAEVDAATRVEKALMSLATSDVGRFGFDRAFHNTLKKAVNTGVAILYVHPLDDGSIQFEPIDPVNFVAYPHELGDIKRMKTVGHRFWKMQSEITALFEAGKYLTDDVGGGDATTERSSQDSGFAMTAETGSHQKEDKIIECYQVVRRCDLGEGERDYIICVAKSCQKVLKVQELGYKKGRLYFDVRFDDEYDSFWPASSPGNEMQSLQLAFSDLINTLIQGGYSQAFPILAIIGATLNAKMKRYGPGTVWELPANASIQTVNNRFDGSFLVALLPILEKLADAVSRISQLGTSQNMPAGTTATAAAGFLQAQEEGKDQYTTFVAPAVGQIWEFLLEILQVHYQKIMEKHGSTLGLESIEDLTRSYRFLPTGKSSTSSPQVLIQKLQMVMQLAMSPGTKLDYTAIENQILQALDLPFSTQGLLRKTIGEEGWMMIVEGLLTGQMDPEMAAQMLMEAKAALPNQQGTGNVPPQGQPASLPGGGVPEGPEPSPSGGIPPLY